MLHQSIPRTFVGHIYPATVFEPEHDADHLYRPVEHRVFGTSTTRQHLRVDDLLCHLFSSSPLGTLLCKTPYCYMCSRLYITFRSCILLLPFTMLHILALPSSLLFRRAFPSLPLPLHPLPQRRHHLPLTSASASFPTPSHSLWLSTLTSIVPTLIPIFSRRSCHVNPTTTSSMSFSTQAALSPYHRTAATLSLTRRAMPTRSKLSTVPPPLQERALFAGR